VSDCIADTVALANTVAFTNTIAFTNTVALANTNAFTDTIAESHTRAKLDDSVQHAEQFGDRRMCGGDDHRGALRSERNKRYR